MMNCKEVMTKLSTREELGFFQKMDLRMHLLMCKSCSSFRKQLELMKGGLTGFVEQEMREGHVDVKGIEKKILEKIRK